MQLSTIANCTYLAFHQDFTPWYKKVCSSSVKGNRMKCFLWTGKKWIIKFPRGWYWDHCYSSYISDKGFWTWKVNCFSFHWCFQHLLSFIPDFQHLYSFPDFQFLASGVHTSITISAVAQTHSKWSAFHSAPTSEKRLPNSPVQN